MDIIEVTTIFFLLVCIIVLLKVKIRFKRKRKESFNSAKYYREETERCLDLLQRGTVRKVIESAGEVRFVGEVSIFTDEEITHLKQRILNSN